MFVSFSTKKKKNSEDTPTDCREHFSVLSTIFPDRNGLFSDFTDQILLENAIECRKHANTSRTLSMTLEFHIDSIRGSIPFFDSIFDSVFELILTDDVNNCVIES